MKTTKNNLLWTLPLLALMPLASQASEAAEAPARKAIAIDCEHRYISQADAGRVMHTNNFSQTYAKRQSLYANVARTCHSGIRQVLLVVDVSAQRQRAVASK